MPKGRCGVPSARIIDLQRSPSGRGWRPISFDAAVELTMAQLAGSSGMTGSETIDGEAFGKLLGVLDRDITGFKMHQR